jgi:hypothetical protein
VVDALAAALRLVAYHAEPGTPEYDATLLLDTAAVPEHSAEPKYLAEQGRSL